MGRQTRRIHFTLSVLVEASPDRLERLCAVIARSGGNLNMEAAAKEPGIGSNDLSKTLRDEVGTNYRDLRKRIKIRIAAELLAERSLSVDGCGRWDYSSPIELPIATLPTWRLQ
jgi:hypothetical protein